MTAVAVFGLMFALIPATAANAVTQCTSPCVNVSSTPSVLAQELLNNNALTANNPDIINNEIVPIANGTMPADSKCQIDTRILQMLVVVVRNWGSAQVNDINRWCANDGQYTCTGSNASPNHCHLPAAYAVDFGQVGGVSVDGSNARSLDLIKFLNVFMPQNTRVGQSNCRGGTSLASILSSDGQQPPYRLIEFSDTCNHVHVDLNGASGQLSVTNTPAPPPIPTPINRTVFQDTAGNLWTYSPSGMGGLGLGVAPGTSPSVARLTNGSYVVAFQDNTGHLWQYSPGAGAIGTGLGMAAGTSPSIVALPNNGYEIAFQASGANNLYLYSPSAGISQSFGLGMKPGTSPSIARASSGEIVVAFQESSGNLHWYSTFAGSQPTGLGMKAGTSPSVAALANGTFAMAFQANGGNLATYVPGVAINVTGLGMGADTSPSVASLNSGGNYVVAFQDNNGGLWTTGVGAPNAAVGLGMTPGTSPSVAAMQTGGYEIAFVANTGGLWTYYSPGNQIIPTGLGIKAGTSPALAN
ncbi:MAG: hypothetical protein EPO52_12085 [Herbiconiux sp.]|uniref:hypothetical protein n=1 Tax=Herbiconiux sp. TaxID=1871186 RepID=UPI0011F718CF|nr:hypothetical protein [Herbiconiux sp.]TAJ47592.1 MAG: hypothetical protein EPO52_12085 [Herbiconiux sp.]